jgi:hypothetical protein
VDVDEGFKPIGGHVLEGRVADDSGVVDHDVHASPGTKGGVDDRLSAVGARHAVGVGDGLATPLADFLRGGMCRSDVRAFTGDRSTRVVHHDARAARGEQERILLAQAATGAGDHGNLIVESQLVRHQLTGSSFMP